MNDTTWSKLIQTSYVYLGNYFSLYLKSLLSSRQNKTGTLHGSQGKCVNVCVSVCLCTCLCVWHDKHIFEHCSWDKHNSLLIWHYWFNHNWLFKLILIFLNVINVLFSYIFMLEIKNTLLHLYKVWLPYCAKWNVEGEFCVLNFVQK